jgi:hypothetical protein
LVIPGSLFSQEIRFQPIEEDTTFEPYVRYDESSGNYYFGYVKDRETDKVYESVYAPPTKVNPKISLLVASENGGYNYSYVLQNGSDSKQDMMSFELGIKNQFQNMNLPSPWYYRESRELPYIRVVHKILQRPNREEGEPIQFESDLSIGDSLRFSLMSNHLPTIIDSYFKGRPKVINFSFAVPPPVEVEILRDSITTKVANRRGVQLKTIGPRALPDNISNTALTDTLQSYLSFSCDTTWIENPGICRSLEAKLENVRRQLERGNTNPARGSLQAFLNEVDAQKDKQLSSEAWALLWFNGQYLLERL